MNASKYIVGTSGYSFDDWVGPFYPPGTRRGEMLSHYAQRFETVELNFTFYRMPVPRTLARMADNTPPDFGFWVKANREITHEQRREPAAEFIAALAPLRDAGKLQGVLLQFPQSFRRTVGARKFLAAALEDFAALPTAVEFRHRSWEHPATLAGLRERDVALVVPDAPAIADLFRPEPTVTGRFGYLRLHSRDADGWYAGMARRYDYSYTAAQLADINDTWAPLAEQVEKVYAFFNNCHRGQAAANAEAFRRIIGQIK
ncbi:MAG TPA: DUF72 domain-containing protein [Phycisphaerae bacterium]|nr:DUF72 domain-containing protein [Phycisphaerae bacterium]